MYKETPKEVRKVIEAQVQELLEDATISKIDVLFRQSRANQIPTIGHVLEFVTACNMMKSNGLIESLFEMDKPTIEKVVKEIIPHEINTKKVDLEELLDYQSEFRNVLMGLGNQLVIELEELDEE